MVVDWDDWKVDEIEDWGIRLDTVEAIATCLCHKYYGEVVDEVVRTVVDEWLKRQKCTVVLDMFGFTKTETHTSLPNPVLECVIHVNSHNCATKVVSKSLLFYRVGYNRSTNTIYYAVDMDSFRKAFSVK